MTLLKFTFILFFTFLNFNVEANRESNYEVRLGQTVAATILGKYKQSSNTELIHYVNLVGQSIVETSGRRDINYYFTVLDEEEPIALSCPGGFIFITRGLIKMLNNEAELAGILAHEISHVNQKHVFNKVDLNENRSSGASMLTQLLMARHTSTTVALSEISNQTITMVLDKGLNENDEFDSDISAILFLNKTGYNPQAYLDVLSRLPTEKLAHSKTHPNLNDRINALKKLFPESLLISGVRLEERFSKNAIVN